MNKNHTTLQLPKIIGHRGASAFAPENTLAALQLAHQLGVKWVECDVLLSRDKIPIIFHDANLKRITGYNKSVSATPFEQLKSLDVGAWFSEAYRGQKIPSLLEWLEYAAHLEMGLNLEIKVKKWEDLPIVIDQLLLALKTCWFDHLPRPLISSFSSSCLGVIRQRNPDCLLGWIIDGWKKDVLRVLDQHQCVSLHANYQCLTPDRIALIHATHRKVLAYTLDDLDLANYFWNIGVDSIFSNTLLLDKAIYPGMWHDI